MSASEAQAYIKPLSIAGIALSGYLSGMIASISLVTMPVVYRLQANPQTSSAALPTWSAVYHNGKALMPPFAATIAALNLGNAYLQRGSAQTASYLVASAVSTLSIVPFTFATMTATIDRLIVLEEREKSAKKSATVDQAEAAGLLKRWSGLNLTRAALPAIGAVIGYLAL